MRILWLSHRDVEDPAAGGAERTIREVGQRLTRRGHSVHLVARGRAGSKFSNRMYGVRVTRLARYSLLHFEALTRCSHSERPDIVVADLAHVVPWPEPVLAGLPCVAFFRHLHRRSLRGQVGPASAAVLGTLERLYPKIYSHRPFITESVSSALDLRRLGVPPADIHRVPPGVDTGCFTPGEKAAEPLVVYFGGFRRYKQPSHAVHAIAVLRTRGVNVKLVMMGNGPMFDSVVRLVRELELQDRVTLLGRVSENRLVEVVQSAHANLHCSETEGWGYSIMEAAACGVPTVAYKVPGVVESVHEGVTGDLVVGGPEALADGLERVLGDSEGWERRCRAFANQHSWEECANSWEQHLTAIAGR